MMSRSYRPDIDGLRAIAVLSVFLHHINSALLPGGFIGVDIFFVISGYLITAQISEEIQDGSFSVKRFYQRRINRIIPALITVVSAVIALGLILLSPADLMLMTRSAAYAIFGLSNVFFWREYGNYFAANSAEAPLLHTWSLGVEEQFYIVWPLLLLFLFRIMRQKILIVLLILLLFAVFISEMGIKTTASASYYLLPTRFFELMIGGLLTFVVRGTASIGRSYSNAAFVIGMSLVIGSLIWIDKSSSFPGVTAAFPCVGAALLIWSGARPTKFTGLFASKPLIWVGLLSYSLYLWHWPVIVFFKYYGVEIDAVIGTLIFFTALLLSWLSWRFVEIPLRRSGATMSFSGVFFKRFAFPAFCLVALNVLVVQGAGLPWRYSAEVAKLEAAQNLKPDQLRTGCHVPNALFETPPLEHCMLGVTKPEPDGILLGDSFANHFSGMLDVLAKRDGLSFADYTMDGCPPILNFDSGKLATYVKRCHLRNEFAYRHLEVRRYRHVVLASNWPDSVEIAPLIKASIERILSTGAQISIILRNPAIEDANTCPIRNAMYARDQRCTRPYHDQPAYLKELQRQFPMIRFIDPSTVLCSTLGCDPVLEGVVVYRDAVHLNDTGSRLIGQRLVDAGVSLLEQGSQVSSR